MRRTSLPMLGIALLGAAFCPWAQGQQPYVAVATPPSYGNYDHASTLEEGAMNGMANMMSARGSYNLQTSQAAVYATQAQSQEIANHMQYTNTYFQMKATNEAARAQEHPRPTMEELVRVAREGAPQPLTTQQVDPVSGQVAWPALLQYPSFAPQREQIGQLLAKKTSHGGLGYDDQQAFIQAADAMAATLKRGISKVPPQQYVASKDFLKSLLYQTCQVSLE